MSEITYVGEIKSPTICLNEIAFGASSPGGGLITFHGEMRSQTVCLNEIAFGDNAGAALPDQTGHDGEFLTTDGTDASWAALAGGGDMLSTNNLIDVDDVTQSRQNLGLEINVDVPAQTVATKYRFKADGTVQLYNATTSKFHTLSISGADGAVVLAFSAGEA